MLRERDTAVLEPAAPASPVRRPARPARRWKRHLPGLGLQAVVGVWLMRHWLFSSALPAGTDMLGFIQRAKDNSSGWDAFSLWNPGQLGAPRQFTLETPLGLMTKLTGDPVLTVKLVSITLLFLSGALAYWLAWRWFRDLTAATVAGLLYMTSQLSLGQWASGHLNVAVAVTAAPLVLLLWSDGVRRYRAWTAVALGVALSAVFLARLDMVLYLAPFLALYVLVEGFATRRLRGTVRNAAMTALLAGAVVVGLNLYQLLPALGGVRASWLTTSGLFTERDFLDRSVGLFDSSVGFAREIGYLAFIDRQTWYSHPLLPLWLYFGLAAAAAAAAYCVVLFRSGSRVIFLLASAIVASLLAKGIRAPLGDTYQWLVESVPVVGNLRDPNRWLIVQSLAYAVLLGLAVSQLRRWLGPPRSTAARRRLQIALPAIAVLLLLLPNSPTLLGGFSTWSPTAGQKALLGTVGADHRGDFVVATVPYDQGRRFVRAGGYRGWEQDLGSDSSLYTGHQALGDGGWHKATADFVAYTSGLLRSGDSSFSELLGAIGVRYLVSFEYPPTAPHLVVTIPNREKRFQQHAVERMADLPRVSGGSEGSVYRITGSAPRLSFRTNIAANLGGGSGLSALAAMPGVDLSDWAVLDAGAILDTYGPAGLLEVIRRADLVVLANERLIDLAVRSSPSQLRLSGITSDPALDLLTQTVPSSAAVRQGALPDSRLRPPRPGRRTSSLSFEIAPRASRSRQTFELWSRVRSFPTAAQIRYSLDGREVGEATPLAATAAGFRWLKVATLRLATGHHTLRTRASPSAFGLSYDVDETRLIRTDERRSTEGALREALATARGRTAYALDIDDAQKLSQPPRVFSPSLRLSPQPGSYWTRLEPAHAHVAGGVFPSEGAGARITMSGLRRYHTFVQHQFRAPVDWSQFGYLFLRFRGTGSGHAYHLLVDFDPAHRGSADFSFLDDGAGWQTEAFPVAVDTGRISPKRWSHVTSVRLAADPLAGRGQIDVGVLRASRVPRTVAFRYPLAVPTSPVALKSLRWRRIPSSSRRGPAVKGIPVGCCAARELSVRVPFRWLGRDGAVLVPPERPDPADPAVPVDFERQSATRYDFSFRAPDYGMLVFAQAFDPHWEVQSDGRGLAPTETFGVLNGYLFPPGAHTGTVEFRGQTLATLGFALSAALLAALAGGAVRSRRRNRGDR